MSIALYTIAAEYRSMVERLLDSTDDAQTINDTIEAESYPLETKIQQVAYAPKILDYEADMIFLAIKDMQVRAKSMRNKANNIREYIKTSMDVAGITKISCPHFQISIKSNPQSIDIYDLRLIPSEFMRVPDPSDSFPDKFAIKEAIKAGKKVPGAKLHQSTRIEIK